MASYFMAFCGRIAPPIPGICGSNIISYYKEGAFHAKRIEGWDRQRQLRIKSIVKCERYRTAFISMPLGNGVLCKQVPRKQEKDQQKSRLLQCDRRLHSYSPIKFRIWRNQNSCIRPSKAAPWRKVLLASNPKSSKTEDRQI
jgi:hypothetical protein